MPAASLPSPAPAHPRPAYAWTVVAILVLTAVLSYTDRQVLSLLVDPIRHDLGIGETEMGLLLGTAFALVYGVAGLPLGWLADRSSRRNLIVAGVVVWSLGTIACGLAASFTQLFCSRLVVGLGEAALAPAAISLISDCFPAARRGTAVGLFLSGIAIGSGAAILIGGAVLQAVGAGVTVGTPLEHLPAWRSVLLLIGLPGLVWALVVLCIREPRRQSAGAAQPDSPSASAAPAIDALPWRHVAPVYVALAAASLVDNAMGAWAPTLLIRDFHRDAAQVGIELGVLLTIGFGVGVLAGGYLADRATLRQGWKDKLRLCIGAGILILPVVLLLCSQRYGLVLAAVPVYFALSGCITAVGFSAVLDSVPNRARGLAMSISFFLNVALGASLGPSGVALASVHVFGPAAGLGPAIALIAVLGVGVGLTATVFALRRRQ